MFKVQFGEMARISLKINHLRKKSRARFTNKHIVGWGSIYSSDYSTAITGLIEDYKSQETANQLSIEFY